MDELTFAAVEALVGALVGAVLSHVADCCKLECRELRRIGSRTLLAIVAGAGVLTLVGALGLSVTWLAAVVAFIAGQNWLGVEGSLRGWVLLEDLCSVLLAALVDHLVPVVDGLFARLTVVEVGLHFAEPLVRVRGEDVRHVCEGREGASRYVTVSCGLPGPDSH